MFNLENIVNAVIRDGRVKRESCCVQQDERKCVSLGMLEVSQMADGSCQLWHKGAGENGKSILLGILPG